MPSYETEIQLGDRYRDALTGFEGVASSVTFYAGLLTARVSLDVLVDGEIKTEFFDSERLVPLAR